MATRGSPFNAQTRRAMAKAEQCLKRASKIPAGVRSKIAVVAPDWLDTQAERFGVTIGAAGAVTRALPEMEPTA